MDEEPIKICSDCGAKYALHAVTCADCGGSLVFPKDYEKRSVPPEDHEEVVLIRQGPLNYLKELGSLLNKKGIWSDILFHGCEPGT